MVVVSLKVVALEQAKAFWEVVTSDTILGQKLVEKIKCSNPFSPEINFVAVVDIAKEAGFCFTVDEVFEVIYGSEGQRPWDNDDIWFNEATSFIYSSGSIAFDITVNKDVAQNLIYSLLIFPMDVFCDFIGYLIKFFLIPQIATVFVFQGSRLIKSLLPIQVSADIV